jgi:hypothetical protein
MVDSADGDVVTGGICGSLTWGTAPAAPSMVDAVPGPAGSVTVRFSGSGDTGGVNITGWILAYADNPAFSGAGIVASTGTTTLNLTPRKTYWFKSAGRNDLLDAFGRYGAWSGAISATMRSGGKVSVGGAWRAGVVKVSIGGVWRDGIVRTSVGGSWKGAL